MHHAPSGPPVCEHGGPEGIIAGRARDRPRRRVSRAGGTCARAHSGSLAAFWARLEQDSSEGGSSPSRTTHQCNPRRSSGVRRGAPQAAHRQRSSPESDAASIGSSLARIQRERPPRFDEGRQFGRLQHHFTDYERCCCSDCFAHTIPARSRLRNT